MSIRLCLSWVIPLLSAAGVAWIGGTSASVTVGLALTFLFLAVHRLLNAIPRVHAFFERHWQVANGLEIAAAGILAACVALIGMPEPIEIFPFVMAILTFFSLTIRYAARKMGNYSETTQAQ